MICFQKIEKSLDVTPVGAESAIITVVQFSNVLRIEGRLPKETLFDLGIAQVAPPPLHAIWATFLLLK